MFLSSAISTYVVLIEKLLENIIGGDWEVAKKVYELYSDDLAKALKARQDFLGLCGERKEQALAMQKRMSARLKSGGCVNNRLVLINQMMFDKLRELGSELKKLNARLA